MRNSSSLDSSPSLLSRLIMLFSIYPLSVSSPPSPCELQAAFNLNRIYKPGDLVLGAVFEIHLSSVFPDLSFTAEQQQTVCYG